MGEYLRVAIFTLTVAFYPIIAWPQVFSHQNLANSVSLLSEITEGGNKNCWVVSANVNKKISALKSKKRTHENMKVFSKYCTYLSFFLKRFDGWDIIVFS